PRATWPLFVARAAPGVAVRGPGCPDRAPTTAGPAVTCGFASRNCPFSCRNALTMEESGVTWRTSEREGWDCRVPGHPHPAPRRQGPAVPAGEVPRRAGRRRGDHTGAGALPLRLHPRRLRAQGRGAAVRVADVAARPRLRPDVLLQRLRRDAGQAGPGHAAGP